MFLVTLQDSEILHSSNQATNDMRNQLSALFSSSLLTTGGVKNKSEKNPNNKSSIVPHSKYQETGYLEQTSSFM